MGLEKGVEFDFRIYWKEKLVNRVCEEMLLKAKTAIFLLWFQLSAEKRIGFVG